MFAAKYCSLFASKIIVGIIFSVVFLLGVPDLAIYELRELHFGLRCYPTSHKALRVTRLIQESMAFVLPFVFFLPIILLMTLCTKREGNTFGFSQIEERSASDEQMRVVAVTLSSMTLFVQLVLALIRFAFHSHLFMILYSVYELLYFLSIALQPILCFVILKALRKGFRSQLRNIRCCRRLFPSLDREEEAVRLSTNQEDPSSTTEA